MSVDRSSWRTEGLDELCDAFLAMRDRAEVAAFLRDLCTLSEIQAMTHRLQAARLLAEHVPYASVAEQVGTSTTTVTRVAQWLHRGEGGYQLALERTARRDPGA